MSTNLDCQFVEEKPGVWHYLLADWKGQYRKYGPFNSLEQGEVHLGKYHANPGGFSVRRFGE